MISLYIHIPFCRGKCLYCDFYSIPYQEVSASSYVDVLSKQIKNLNSDFSTIYIGGGTPTVLGNNLLARLLGELKPLSLKASEFTIEANPESLSKDNLALFADMGVNRISLGMQSLNDDKLRKLGRMHSVCDTFKALELLQHEGFKNISIDLIFGLWDESLDDWEHELNKAGGLFVTHISCYSLTYEKDTPLFIMHKKGDIVPLEDEVSGLMYKRAIDYLEGIGFKQYEISNFAKAGYACKHNLNYWENNYYIGLGASAVSFTERLRQKNIANVDEYIRRLNCGSSPVDFSEKLGDKEWARETLALKIRTSDGIDFRWFTEKTGFDFMELQKDVLDELITNGLIAYKKDKDKITGVYLTKKGFLYSDMVSSAFL